MATMEDSQFSNEESQAEGSTNLIINYLPQALTDQEFYSIFAEIGAVNSARIIRDRSTGYSYGYGFVKYQSPKDATRAILELNGLFIMNKHIKVAYSLPSGQDNRNINLYIKGLPASATNDGLRKLFEHLGTIIECRAIPDKITGACQGIGFVLFSKREEAELAIEEMNNKMVGSASEPLIVKFSKTEQKKPPSTFGPMQHYPTQYPIQAGGPMRNMYAGSNMRGMGNMRGMSRNINRYSPISGSGYGFMNNPLSGGQTTHAPGNYIVFIYGIGPCTTEHMLWQMCSPYGTLRRVNVIKDHAKGQGKGYGFVTYGTLDEANYCVQSLNGSPFEGRSLQVSLKS